MTKKRNWRYRLVIVTYRLVALGATADCRRSCARCSASLLCVVGLLGFLPILGFWMFPLGVALVISDFPPLRRRLEHWLNETRRRYHMDLLKSERRRDAA